MSTKLQKTERSEKLKKKIFHDNKIVFQKSVKNPVLGERLGKIGHLL